MKGILLAGGAGTRLYPAHPVHQQTAAARLRQNRRSTTRCRSLMLAGIREILIISTPRDLPRIRRTLPETARQLGLKLSYVEPRPSPTASPRRSCWGADFIGNSPVCLILGDNIFYGHDLTDMLADSAKLTTGSRVFAYQVKDPERYGVVEFDHRLPRPEHRRKTQTAPQQLGRHRVVLSTIRCRGANRPRPQTLCRAASTRSPTSTACIWRRSNLQVQCMGRGVAWLDTGTYDSLLSQQFAFSSKRSNNARA